MALNLEDRVRALGQDQAMRLSVVGALAKHAKWVLRAEGQPSASVTFARNVLTAPDAYALRFGVAILTEPVFDAVIDLSEIDDTELQDTVSTLWALFVPDEIVQA